ncbi:MAG: fasciclin domain-containing protein [Pyrinomonadaceae bacterium]
MKKLIFAFFLMAMVVGFGLSSVSAQDMKGDKMMKDDKMMKSGNPMVGGAAMYKNKDIIDNAVNSKDHTTLVAAVKAAGLVDTLKGKGPFTVFAPTNEAFDALPAGTVDTLLKPENKAMLTKILTYHVIAGNYDSKASMKAIKKGNGKAMFKTVAGGTLTASMDGNTLVLTDEKGGMSRVTIADVKQSNGVIHVVDTVLMPS